MRALWGVEYHLLLRRWDRGVCAHLRPRRWDGILLSPKVMRILQPQTGGGQNIYFFISFSFSSSFFFMPICVFFSCKCVFSFASSFFLHAHRCFFMRDCVYRLRPLKLRLPSHLLLNPLCYPLLPWSASHFLLFCFSCCEMYLNCRSRVAETI